MAEAGASLPWPFQMGCHILFLGQDMVFIVFVANLMAFTVSLVVYALAWVADDGWLVCLAGRG